MPHSICFITTPDARSAERISRALLRDRLAACVNRLSPVRSSYRWKGRIEHSREVLLMVKTRSALAPALIRSVRKIHPYAVPEIVFAPISRGHAPYLRWIEDSTRP